MLLAQDIQPGDEPSYQLCKTIYSYHPLGRKMAEAPVSLAQSQQREITCPDSPEDVCVRAFHNEWQRINADKLIANTRVLSRIYGIASVACLVDGQSSMTPLDYKKLWNQTISFNVLDPLNTAGSLVLNQQPNAMDFQKWSNITIAGQPYHRSRSVTVLNEEPLYIEYTNSAFGFVGRSVYQRALYPMKSFVQSMVTDDLVTIKAGVLVAKIRQPGSVIDNLMANIAGFKRQMLKDAATGNVLSIAPDEDVSSLDFTNLDGAFGMARKDILKNIATAADMPAVIIENETLTEGFGEGTEDAKSIARFVDRERMVMKPLYDYFDEIVMARAWNPEFYKTVQAQFPEEYGSVDFNTAFYRWKNSFSAIWPNLLTEPDSEKIKTQDVVFKAAIAAVEVLLPACDPDNKIRAMQFLADTLNSQKLLFPEPLVLDYDAMLDYAEEQKANQDEMQQNALQEPQAGSKTFERADALTRIESRPGMRRYSDAAAQRVAELTSRRVLRLSDKTGEK